LTKNVSNTTDSVNQIFKDFFAESDWPFKVGIGCLINGAACGLLLINLILLPISFCLWSCTSGYILMTAASKVGDPASKLPSWRNVLELLAAGGTWIAATFGHFLLLPILAIGSLYIAEATGLDNVLRLGFVPWAALTWSALCALTPLISFFSFYLMINFAVKQEGKAAFDLAEVLSRLRRAPIPLLQVWLIQAGLLYLAVVIPILTLLGLFIIPSTIFLAQLLGCCMASQAWRAADQGINAS
jgi:hypothetical protein